MGSHDLTSPKEARGGRSGLSEERLDESGSYRDTATCHISIINFSVSPARSHFSIPSPHEDTKPCHHATEAKLITRTIESTNQNNIITLSTTTTPIAPETIPPKEPLLQFTTTMASDAEERLDNELALVLAMYPDQVEWDPHSREATFRLPNACLKLRLQDDYLTTGRPVIISASVAKTDISDAVRQRLIEEFNPGEEILDSTIMIFDELAAHHELEASSQSPEPPNSSSATTDGSESGDATVIVWLHHLLNTNKRKLALSPDPSVSGITKPGYPGVLMYSGPAKAVREHVNELKGQNWAAFQVRLEEAEAWEFSHGKGVREVEAMGDVVAAVGEARKAEFMQAMKIK